MNFATTTELLPHQRRAVEKLRASRLNALLMAMQTGKSRVVIELAKRRANAGKIDRVVWWCPCALRQNVRAQIIQHTDVDPDVILAVGDREHAESLEGREWIIIGIESMSASRRVFGLADAAVNDRTFVVLDESTYCKRSSAKRSRHISAVAEKARYRAILTAEPLAQGGEDLYSQMRFLSPKILGYNTWSHFASYHVVWSETTKGRIEKIKNMDALISRIAPYAFEARKSDCLTIPPISRNIVSFKRSHRQIELSEAVKEDFFNDLLKYEEYSSIPAFRMMSRLHAIACGLGESGLDEARLDCLMAEANAADDERIIVFCKHVESVRAVAERLRLGFGANAVATFTGTQSSAERENELARWRAEGGSWLVLSLGVGSHGLSLQAATRVIYYSSTFKYMERCQSEERCQGIGQTQPVTYVDIISDAGIEEMIYDCIARKTDAGKLFRDKIRLLNRNKSDVSRWASAL